MAQNNETTTKFKVDISELKSGIQEANRQIRLANAEFKAASSGMDNWGKSTDGVSAKIKQLETVLQSENTKLTNLKQQLALVEQEQGKNSKGADELRIAIANQQAAVNKTEKSLNDYKGKLNDLENGLDDVADASEEAEKSTKSLGDGFTVLKGAAASLLADGIKSIGSAIMNAVGETREYRNEMAKLETAFAAGGHSVDTAKKTYEDFYAVLGDEGQATEAVNFLAKMTDNEKDLATWTDICTGVYGEFGASLPIEGLTEAANETAKVGQVTGPLADALNWAGISEDKFNEKLKKCSSEQERQKLIMDTLNDTYSESATKFRETNKEVMDANAAQGALTDSMARLGEKAEPIISAVKQGFADLLDSALDLVEGVDFSGLAEKIRGGFSDFTENVLPKIKEGFQWILDNKDLLIAGLGGIAAGFVAFNVVSMIQGVVSAFKAFKAAQEGATIAQWLLNVAMNANPIGLIVAAIAGLVAAFVLLWNNCEGFRNFWIGLWENIKSFAGTAIDAIANFFTVTIPQALDTMGTFFSELPGKIGAWLSGVIDKVKSWASNMGAKAKETGTNFINTIVNFFKELPGKIWTWLVNVVTKVLTWRQNMIDKAKETASKFISTVIDYVKDLPGKVWTQLNNVINKVTTWASNMADKAKNAATNFVNNFINFVKNLPSNIWNTLSDVISKVISWGSDLAAKGLAAATELVTSIVTKVQELPGKMLDVGKNLVEGVWTGMSNGLSWIKGKIKGWVGDVTKFIKNLFGIKSPSRVMRDEVGKMLAYGMAVGIEKGKDKVLDAFDDLVTDSRSEVQKVLDETNETILESEQFYADEALRIAREKGEAEKDVQEVYLDNLKATAEQERKIYDAQIRDTENLKKNIVDTYKSLAEEAIDSIEELEKTQEDFAKKLTDVGDLFEINDNKGGLAGLGENLIQLTDLSPNTEAMEEYADLLLKIKERANVPTEFFEMLRDMSVADGMQYATALLKLNDKEFEKYIEDWKAHQAAAAEISKTLYQDEAEALAVEITGKFDEVENEFFGVGENSATEFESGFLAQLETVVLNVKSAIGEAFKNLLSELGNSSVNVKVNMPGAIPQLASGGVLKKGQWGLLEGRGAEAVVPLENNSGWIRKTAADLKRQIAGQGLLGSGNTTTTNTYDFTQNIYSPKPLSRLEIYRQTKNYLNYAKGV